MVEKDLTMDVELEEEEKKSSKLIIIIIIGVVLLMLVGGAAFFLLAGDSEGDSEPVPVEEEIQQPAIYMPLRPAFVVNFANAAGKTRFLQVEVTLMGRDPIFMASLEDHIPLIKNRLVDVLQAQEFSELRNQDGKEAMRGIALEELQILFTEELGSPGIEKLWFTTFILQ